MEILLSAKRGDHGGTALQVALFKFSLTESRVGFSAIDYFVLAAYLVGITVFGTLFRRSQQTVRDYFIGSKNTSWIVISLSIVATETSTLTLIGVPALAY